MATVALVTGGNSGIGLAVVRELASRGMSVYCGSRDRAKGMAAISGLADAGDVRLAMLDLARPDTFQPVLDEIEARHGKLDVLINNAGVSLHGNAIEIDPETVRLSFETNLHGPMRLTQLAIPLLRKSDCARVVNVSTHAARFAFLRDPPARIPRGSLPYGYCVSKAALNAATVMFAEALEADGIKVNACSPGLVKTQVSRFTGTRTPADGAEIIVRLATQGDATGQFFDENGQLDW